MFTDDGKINTNGGPDFTGMPRFAAREAIVEALKNQVTDLIVTYTLRGACL